MADNDWNQIRLGQLARLVQLAEYGQASPGVDEVNPATYSRDIDTVEKALGVGMLTDRSNRERTLTAKGKILVELVEPFLRMFERVVNHEVLGPNPSDRRFRIGAGGSLVSWLIGSRLEQIKQALTEVDTSSLKREAPMVVADVLRNREIALRIASGALDCGLIRKSASTDARLFLKSKDLGTVKYFLYIPTVWYSSSMWSSVESDSRLSEQLEDEVLRSRPIATVGPEGEFRLALNGALSDKRIVPNIEFQYRAFPMVLPHMHLQSHATIMPDMEALGGEDASKLGYTKRPLRLMENTYKRDIVLAYREDHLARHSWIKIELLAECLRF
ncbi:MAG: LysR family transcriptional regulator [Verrucomicrobiaceae bacterium]|nr:LysR family transcriptional regulator [Verrucomicrobiaceae bacterium]